MFSIKPTLECIYSVNRTTIARYSGQKPRIILESFLNLFSHREPPIICNQASKSYQIHNLNNSSNDLLISILPALVFLQALLISHLKHCKILFVSLSPTRLTLSVYYHLSDLPYNVNLIRSSTYLQFSVAFHNLQDKIQVYFLHLSGLC